MRCFAETSFYIAVVNPSDAHYKAARTFISSFRGRIITTEYVLIEVGNWLARTGDREVFISLSRRVASDPKTHIVAAERSLYAAGFDLYASRPDKEWSFTDCISFVVMQRFGLKDALTVDHHFGQAGYRCLLLGAAQA